MRTITPTFVATLDIKRIDLTENVEGTGADRTVTEAKETSTQVASFVLKSDSLEQLRVRVANHVSLIDEVAFRSEMKVSG